jgi:hypothetical protein
MGRAVVKPVRVLEMGTERLLEREEAYLCMSAASWWAYNWGILPSKPSRNDEVQHAEAGHDLLARISHGGGVVLTSVRRVPQHATVVSESEREGAREWETSIKVVQILCDPV